MAQEFYTNTDTYPDDPYLAARELDPLNLDDTLATLPELNARQDVPAKKPQIAKQQRLF